MGDRCDTPSGPDPGLDARVREYLHAKPLTKQSIASKEIYSELDLTQRQAADSMARLAADPDAPVGERMDKREARWRLR